MADRVGLGEGGGCGEVFMNIVNNYVTATFAEKKKREIYYKIHGKLYLPEVINHF